MAFTNLPMDLNHVWMGDDKIVPSSMPTIENKGLLPSSAHAMDSQEPKEDVDGVASLFGPSQAINYSSYFTDNIIDQQSPPTLLPSRAPAGNLMVR
ncbi:hypothetical protein L7F22_037884 [Adiantum nelumboides]|nr:hypothetical protein [Adiantum nelumboides]